MMTPEVKSLLDFSGSAVIVTGAGSGIGRGVALRFAEAGASVVVHYRASLDGARAVMNAIVQRGGKAVVQAGDLTIEEDATSLVTRAVDAFGRVDVLVNNAGLYTQVNVLDMTLQQWDQVIAASLRSIFLCTRAAAKQMVAQEAAVRSSTLHPLRPITRRPNTATTTQPRVGR